MSPGRQLGVPGLGMRGDGVSSSRPFRKTENASYVYLGLFGSCFPLPCCSFKRKSVLLVRVGCCGAAEGCSARSAARQGSGRSQREGTPNLFLSLPFIHYPGALWQFRLPWRSRMRRCPPRVEPGCQIARLRFFIFGADFNIHPPAGAECGSCRGVLPLLP